ncbi:fumarylacetoacetate hydrolase family protein [Pigmentiphaga soli]|uniref:Fumarylacetoacetate hydrolase family protein n=1 Tax=Pigmentiphaga soli TaxID=1007095 RepID=A0ABP8HEZ2_9BURK
MRFLSFVTPDGRPGWGKATDQGIVDLSAVAPTLREAIAAGRLAGATGSTVYAESEIKYLPVIPSPDKILCVGLNYRSHVLETGRELPAKPSIFTRFANTQVGHGQPMIRPRVSEKFDYEGELAVVIGKTCRHVARADALSVVAGYACYNDGSIRDWQRHTIQYTPGKNFPATGGFGPWLATPDELGDLGRRAIRTRLNGQEMQHATFDDLIFDVPALIEYCSTFTQLEPGDVIITGTTGGVGAFREPPVWMKAGDVVEVEIEGIGTLRNTIADE